MRASYFGCRNPRRIFSCKPKQLILHRSRRRQQSLMADWALFARNTATLGKTRCRLCHVLIDTHILTFSDAFHRKNCQCIQELFVVATTYSIYTPPKNVGMYIHTYLWRLSARTNTCASVQKTLRTPKTECSMHPATSYSWPYQVKVQWNTMLIFKTQKTWNISTIATQRLPSLQWNRLCSGDVNHEVPWFREWTYRIWFGHHAQTSSISLQPDCLRWKQKHGHVVEGTNLRGFTLHLETKNSCGEFHFRCSWHTI